MEEIDWLTIEELEVLCEDDRAVYERRIRELLANSDNDDEDIDFTLDNEEERSMYLVGDMEYSDAEELQIPEFNSIETDSDDDSEEFTESSNEYKARDDTIWLSEPAMPRKLLAHNVLRCSGIGPTRKTKGLSILHTFKSLMSAEICDIIIRETNRKAKQYFDKVNTTNPSSIRSPMKPLTMSELDSYLGILLLAGATHSNNVNSTDLWKTNAHPLFRATMSLNRFWEITRFIRFDDGRTRADRKRNDKSAAISEIFEMLNANLRAGYVAGSNVTIDEQLFPYRGGTGFTQYIPSKPAKYGIKVWWACDAASSYPISGQIYTGLAPSGQRERNQGERVVKELSYIFRGSGRSIICDNFFTSYNLAISLMLDYKLALLGTVNKRRTFVPNNFSNPKGREVQSTVFGFSENVTMCSYIPKKNRAVVLLSTIHYDKKIQGPKKKPQMIIDYNKFKGGVDSMDKCLSEYSTKRKTNRWPLAFFYNILDIAAFAAYKIYIENNPHTYEKNRRRLFLQELSEQLAIAEIQSRSENKQIMRHFGSRSGVESILGHPLLHSQNIQEVLENRDASGRIKHKGNCYLCKTKRSTRKACERCQKPVCGIHAVHITRCNQCA
uniref:PiggyBac transposable element-derived protein domain-containing protein n=2 Tax=Anopheles atroparvus TaxID=41427 RepID=A0AAG5D1Q7_ANOAO